jgi:lysophospholipase L1-like esterase
MSVVHHLTVCPSWSDASVRTGCAGCWRCFPLISFGALVCGGFCRNFLNSGLVILLISVGAWSFEPGHPAADPVRAVEAPGVVVAPTGIGSGNSDREVRRGRGITILQFGDSHTAADYFTGEVRRRLQARYGNGGPGFLVLGCPHPREYHAIIKSSCTPGWTYSSIQKSESLPPFSLSGFTASATKAGEIISLSADEAVPYDGIEIGARAGPAKGAIEVSVDNVVRLRRSLADSIEAPVTLSVSAPPVAPTARHRTRRLREISIKVTDNGPVDLGGISIFDRSAGVSLSNIGFSGATVGVIDKFGSRVVESELERLAPDVVILAFGTNEGFHDDTDLAEYRALYSRVIGKIRAAQPDAKLVMILPPDAERLPSACAAASARAACAEPTQVTDSQSSEPVCVWQRPPKLGAIREIERDIAQQEKIPVWDWSKLVPPACGAHSWARERHLMTADHVHFTAEGYRVSAQQFAKFLFPIIDAIKQRQAASLLRNR